MNSHGYLEVNSLIWDKDTHGLFDYESKVVYHRNTFKVVESCSVYRTLNMCYIENGIELNNSVGLLQVERKVNGFQVSLIETEDSNKMWLVIRKIENSLSGYKLSEGDWVKMGRIRFKVIKVCSQPGLSENNLLPQFFCDKKKNNGGRNDLEMGFKSSCRICLSDVECQADPLISPCRCDGTMKFIHLYCLKEWLKSKITAKVTEKGMSFHIKDLVCELCKGDFPFIYTYNEQKIPLLNMEFPTKPYIILEEFRPDNLCRHALHIISLNPKQYASLGRGHDCDIKIADISVSRKHCKISFNDGHFYAEDCKSKFGTLIKLKKSFLLKPRYSITIQIKQTVLKLEYKVPWSLSQICKCCDSERVAIDNFSFLTHPEYQDSDSDQEDSRLHLTNSNYRPK